MSKQNTDSSKKHSKSKEKAKTKYHVGDVIEDGKARITYVASGDYTEDNQFMQPDVGKKYVFMKFAFENLSDSKDETVSLYNFTAYADGYAAEMHYSDDNNLSATLSAGKGTEGSVIFEVPNDSQKIEVEYETNVFTKKKIKFIFDGNKDSGFILKKSAKVSTKAYKVGQTADISNMKMTYVSCENYTSDSEFIQPAEGCHYVTLTFDCKNTSKTDQSVSFYSFDGYADGKAIEQAYLRDDGIGGTISAGRNISGTVVFQVPDDAKVVEAEYLDNIWTSKRIVFKIK